MALEIKWGRSPDWYGRFIRDGKRTIVNLGVSIEGKPPATRRLKDKGDTAFEKSRLRAALQLERAIKEFDCQQSEEQLLRRIHALKTGKHVSTIELDEIVDRYGALPRKRPISESGRSQNESRLKKFVAFVRTQSPKAKYMADVEAPVAEDFMASMLARGVSPKTYNDHLIFLKGVFERLKKRAGMVENPFADIPLRDRAEIGRDAFLPEELDAILVAVRKPEHEFIRPVILTGICTAMRRGDCCSLLWADVNLEREYVEAVTAKTKVKVTIPLSPLLAEEIRKFLPRRGEYVFEAQRRMYETNPDGITYRVQRVLEDAGFFDTTASGTDGHRGNVTQARASGIRAASIRGFHSFRVTWATSALLAGVKEDLVRKVTGHKTVSILFDHYFKPGREELRRTLKEKMPQLFSARNSADVDVASTQGTIRDKLTAMTMENWSQIRDEILSMLEHGAA